MSSLSPGNIAPFSGSPCRSPTGRLLPRKVAVELHTPSGQTSWRSVPRERKTMKNKGLGVRSVLEMTEYRAKGCQVSGRSPASPSQVKGEHGKLRRGLVATTQLSCAPAAVNRLVSWKEVAGYLHCTIRS